MTPFSGLLPAGIVVLERGWLSANNILLVGEGHAAVVDTGYSSHADQTVELIRHALAGQRLDVVLNTHLHSDHCGGNAALLAQYPAARVLIPPGQSAAVRNWDPEALSYTPTGQYCPPFMFDGLLCNGEEIPLGGKLWQVHAAPGHDPHSVVLFEPVCGVLISADALWENGFGVVFQELEGEDAFDEVRATLDLIGSLAPRVVIPGHGKVFTDVDAALARAHTRLESFIHDPTKHALHAAKVLLKFKLLELQRVDVDALRAWADATRYFEMVRMRFFAESSSSELFARLLADLLRSGAAAQEGRVILNA